MHIPDSQISLVQRLVKQGRVDLCFNIFNLVLCISTDGYLILDKLGGVGVQLLPQLPLDRPHGTY